MLRGASGSPVSTTVFKPLITNIQPPDTLLAVFGEFSSSSWTRVSLVMPPGCYSSSHVTRLGGSAASSGS